MTPGAVNPELEGPEALLVQADLRPGYKERTSWGCGEKCRVQDSVRPKPMPGTEIASNFEANLCLKPVA